MRQLRNFILGGGVGGDYKISQFSPVSELCENAVVTEGRHLREQKTSCFAHLLVS